jgi:heme A synthase
MTYGMPNPARLLQRFAWAGAGLALGLIVLGGIVRITGSGMGCGEHWPRCKGEWFPPLDLPTMIEIGHRWAAALVTVMVFAVAAVAWRRHRREPALRTPATVAAVLLVVQVLLGAVTVKLALPPWVIITHLANAMLLLAVLLVVALRAGLDPAARAQALPRGQRHRAHGLVVTTAGLGFMVILFGGQVANFHAGLLCLGFPLCNGRVLPPAAPLAALHWTHRLLAFGFLVVVSVLVGRVSRRTDPRGLGLRRWAAVVLAATVAQIGVGASMVLGLLPPTLRAAHLLAGTLVWATLVVLMFHSARTPVEEPGRSHGNSDGGSGNDTVTGMSSRTLSVTVP